MRRPGWRLRPVSGHTVAVLAPLTAACVLAAARASLWDTLDIVWFLLAYGAFAHWALCSRETRRPLPELLSLGLLMVLLFPVISADDDLLVFRVPNEKQSTISAPEEQKQAAAVARLYSSPAVISSLFPAWFATVDLVAEPPTAFPAAPAGHATGNHSPPLV